MKWSDDPVSGFGQAGGILAGLAGMLLGVRKLITAIRTRPLRIQESQELRRLLCEQNDKMDRIASRLEDTRITVTGISHRVKKLEVAQEGIED